MLRHCRHHEKRGTRIPIKPDGVPRLARYIDAHHSCEAIGVLKPRIRLHSLGTRQSLTIPKAILDVTLIPSGSRTLAWLTSLERRIEAAFDLTARKARGGPSMPSENYALAQQQLSILAGREAPIFVTLFAAGGRNTWIWGTGAAARLLVQRLRTFGIEPAGVIDKADSPALAQIENLPVRSAASAREARAEGAVIVVVSKQSEDILKRIHQDGDWRSTVLVAPPPTVVGPFLAMSCDERIRRTVSTIQHQRTDMERWRDSRNLAPVWGVRSMRASRFIAPKARVLDLGAGAQTLKHLLPDGCHYTPSDVVARTADTAVADLNCREFPPGYYDVVTALGVLEYVHDLSWLFERIRQAAPVAVVSYPLALDRGSTAWLKAGAVNNLPLRKLVTVVEASGWRIGAIELYEGVSSREWLFLISARGIADPAVRDS